MNSRSQRKPILIALALCALAASAASNALPAAQQTTSVPGAGSGAGAAAVVDGHVIRMTDVESLCLRTQREAVVGQMIQNFVIERECARRGIAIGDAEIDRSVTDLRKEYAPAVLEDTIAAHGWTMAQLRHQIRAKLGRQRLVEAGIKPVKMAHCREILVKCKHGEVAGGVGSAGRSEAESLAILTSVRDQLRQDAEFGGLAARYSELAPPAKNGDIGVLYSNMLGNVEAPVLAEALALKKGEVSKSPVKTAEGYCLIQTISTSDDHAMAEDAAYQAAGSECRRVQAMFLEPKIVGNLIRQSKITYATDAELVPGKPLPRAAAVIDGHPIPTADVLAQCIAGGGRASADSLVQNYVVDRECERRGVVVSDSEVEQAVADLRRRIAPHTIEEGLPAHHTTMAGLRRDFKQQIERTKLVLDQVPPAPMVHCRIISLRDMPAGQPAAAVSVPRPPSLMDTSAHTEPPAERALAILSAVQARLKAGKDFGELARQYSDAPSKKLDGDAGIFYPGIPGADTALLSAALTMTKGQITPEPVKTYDGYVLIQAVSTRDDHVASEALSYAAALAAYKEQQAQPLIPQAVRELVQKSKVTYFLKF